MIQLQDRKGFGLFKDSLLGSPLFQGFILSLVVGSVIPIRAQCKIEEAAKLMASDGAATDGFGISVSLSGRVALVGADWHDDAGTNSGSAYVYRYNGTNWTEETKLLASDAAALDQFGHAVAVSGDVAVVGAWGDDDAGGLSGSAYVYRYDGGTWLEEAKLTASNGAAEDYFGWSVSVCGDLVVVGAWANDEAGLESGSAYVYRHNGTTWLEEATLTASDAEEVAVFGWSVSVSADVVLVGAMWTADAGNSSGSAYVFRYDGGSWVEEVKLTASDAEELDWFGYSVSAFPCMDAMQYRAREIAWSIEDFTRRFHVLGTRILVAMGPPPGGIITD